jgi:gluconate 5-dehydrogenase
MTEKHFSGLGEDKIKMANPMGRFGSEWDLKGAVVFLASAASDFITGVTIPVDGGSNALS